MSSTGLKQKLITIERAVRTPDGQGGFSTTWTPRCTVWAHERPLMGREAIAAQQLSAVLSSVWEIHYRTDVSVTDRIRFGTRVLEIAGVMDPEDARRELQLLCAEVQA